MHKRLLYIGLLFGLSLSLSPSLYAQSTPTIVATGNCGDQEPSYDGCVHLCDQPNATWTLYSDSTLVIEGTGRMGSYVTEYRNLYGSKIKSVHFSAGIEYIGRYALSYLNNLEKLHRDESIPLLCNNLVYLGSNSDSEYVDRDILYSILDKDPKRAEAYWFVSVNVLNEPDTMEYFVDTFGTDHIFRVRLDLGFKCSPLVNVYLRQIVQDLQQSGELPAQKKKYSIYGPSTVGTFKFCMIRKSVTPKTELSAFDEFILNTKYRIRRLAGSKVEWYGLDTSSIIVETVPLITGGGSPAKRIRRVD